MARSHAKRLPDIVVLIALCAACWLALPAASANAATNAKQRVAQPVKKPEVKKQEAKKQATKKQQAKKEAAKPAAKKETKPAREAAARKPAAKKTAQRKGKPVKQAAKAKRGKKVADEDDDDEDEQKPQVPPLTGDLAVVKKVIDLAREGETDDATEAAKAIADPAGQKLVEWFILREPDSQARFARYAAFIAANPAWPSHALLRRRAEARLWQEKADAATIRAFFTDKAPLTAKGRFALARALLAEGDRIGAAREVKIAWRTEELGEATEEVAFDEFKELLAREDHRARMD